MDIINASIYTMNNENTVIKNGYIKTENGKITETGEMSAYTRGTGEILDAEGANAYPGFIDAHTHLGMFEDGLCFEGDDGNESTDPVTPQLRAIDAVNPFDRCFSEALESGVTTVLTGPGSANPIAGQIAAIKTYGKRIDDMVVMAPAAMKFALGENPKSVYNDKNQTPITRMATAALIRETLQKASRYMKDKAKASADDELEPPEYDAKCEALIPLLEGKIPAHFHAHRADDIFTALRIAKEFSLDAVIVHATEGYLIADELKKENVPVLAGPYMTDRSKPELKNLSRAATGIMCGNGIETAIITDHPETPIQFLTLSAAIAVREGMDETDAIRAITSTAAKICKIYDRVGSLEAGKDADIVLIDGSPLDIMIKPKYVICANMCIWSKTKKL